MATEPAAGAVRRSIQQSLGAKLIEVTGLVDALNLEIFHLAERCENTETELAKYVGWEPTVREEYDHACGQLEKVATLVRAFRDDHLGHLDRPGAEESVIAFVNGLRTLLEMP